MSKHFTLEIPAFWFLLPDVILRLDLLSFELWSCWMVRSILSTQLLVQTTTIPSFFSSCPLSFFSFGPLRGQFWPVAKMIFQSLFELKKGGKGWYFLKHLPTIIRVEWHKNSPIRSCDWNEHFIFRHHSYKKSVFLKIPPMVKN